MSARGSDNDIQPGILHWIIRSSIRVRTVVLALAAGLLVVGASQLPDAPVDVLPEFSAPVVRVQTESLGLSANEVEELITVPMEQDLLNGVKGAQEIRSDSVPGLSSVDLVFGRGTNVLQARQLVQERLTQAHALPNVSRPPQMLEPVSSTSHVMIVGLSSRRLSPIELSVLARWTIRPKLMGLDGVANVAIWGQRERQLQVLVDPERLRDNGISLAKVVRTTGNSQLVSPLSYLEASTPGTGGFVEGPNQRLSVRHVLPFGTPRDLAQVPIDGRGGATVRLGDVARVVEGHQPLIGDGIVQGGFGLLLVVDKLPGANTLDVTRAVDDALSELVSTNAGVTVDRSVFRPATFIESAIHNVALMLVIAGVLVLLALAAFLRRLRAVLVGVVAIPLSLCAALLVLDVAGQTVNALVLAGLAIALVVVIDDAIGATENIARRLRERRTAGDADSTARAVLDASLELRSPLAYAGAIVLVATAPVLFAKGLTASFVRPMALSFALAVAASMLVALTVTPALSVLLASSEPRRPRPSRLGTWLAAAYGRLLDRTLRAPAVALLACCAVGVVALALVPALMQPHPPSFKERDLLVRLTAPPGTSLTAMDRIARNAIGQLRAVPGVRNAGADIGRAVTGDQPVGTNSGQIWVGMDGGADYDRTLASIRRVTDRMSGVTASVQTYESERSAGVLRAGRDELAVRVFGEDYGVLAKQAHAIGSRLSRIDGVQRPRVDAPVQQPTIQIKVKLGSALRHKITPGDVRRAAATLLSGITVGDFFERQKVFEVVVWGVPSTRASVASVRDLVIDKPGGGHVTLGEVTDVRVTRAPVDIRHDAVSRYVDVHMDVSGRGLGDAQRDVRGELRTLQLPLEYHAELLGAPAADHTTGGDFVIFLSAAALGILLLLQAAFGSWRLASLLFLALPTALVGGVVAAFVTGNEHSLGAAAGLMAVFALAVRQGVVLVRHLQRLERDGRPLDSAAVVAAMRERFVPTLASPATIALAMLPLVVLGPVAGNEITHPAAIVILVGLLTSTALSLLVVPAAYLGSARTKSSIPGRRHAAR